MGLCCGDMVIKTKAIFQPIESSDGYRVLITRYYPRGVSRDNFDEWVSVLSPSPELLSEYKERHIDWDAFMSLFLKELRCNVGSQEALRILNELSKKHDVTLLCYEKSGTPCHRHLVRELVENPQSLDTTFEPKYTYDHERTTVQSHITDQ